ncbi:hypothetical protein SAMN04488238_105172 [Roseicitreum antarcticum]|uniref:Uncharacterized protein n=1 Tax=Roseicitreum antarcticum TaxID=564137 RepID=A0A1H2YYI4_9RHOB|nr:hypothetical protein SAMN04488238_105172 [Roseicitreum antarcticum]
MGNDLARLSAQTRGVGLKWGAPMRPLSNPAHRRASRTSKGYPAAATAQTAGAL